MFIEFLDGVMNGGAKLFVAYIGFVMFRIGQILARDSINTKERRYSRPKWKAYCWTFSIAVVLGLISSGPIEVRDDANPLFGGGTVAEIEENSRTYKSFMSIFVFVSATMTFGVVRADDE